jgi:hypothetical protein
MKSILPPREEIPAEFYNGRTPWNEVFSKWFFSGLPEGTSFICKSGVVGQTAYDHLRAIIKSFEPKHEHKEGAVAWLMSLWFEDITNDGKSLVTGKPVTV